VISVMKGAEMVNTGMCKGRDKYARKNESEQHGDSDWQNYLWCSECKQTRGEVDGDGMLQFSSNRSAFL
jgi:hypothetical protein